MLRPLVFLLLLLQLQASAQSLTVRFRSEMINLEVTEEMNRLQYSIEELLNDHGRKTLLKSLKDEGLNFDFLSEFRAYKIFPNLSWRDSISVSRSGDQIYTPKFWATFRVTCDDMKKLNDFYVFANEHAEMFKYAEWPPAVLWQSLPNDTLFSQQYSLNFNPLIPEASINIEQAWDIETGKSFVKVGVLDNGIDTLHEDIDVLFGGAYFQESIIGQPPAWGSTVGTGISHGTQVASIIAARRNNGLGIAGIAGGDGSDTSGISLIDLRVNQSPGAQEVSYYIVAAAVDGARAVGSYWDYPDNYYQDPNTFEQYSYFGNAPGFGLNVQNHSYMMKAQIPVNIDEGGKDVNDPVVYDAGSCRLCREAFLFSLKNGVINVVARGNSGAVTPNPITGQVDLTAVDGYYPQSFPDSWIISVGASGYDGTTVRSGINQGTLDSQSDFESLYGGNMDLIAPGSDSIVKAARYFNGQSVYESFNGTSAAAPHVSGVVGLLLSHYNRSCYVNENLAVEDVEYILENSATDVLSAGPDLYSAYGRLNAYDALKMIEYPIKQFVHPTTVVSTQLVSRDTIAIEYGEAFTDDAWGPLSAGFEPINNSYYQVERLEYHVTYDYSMYLTPSTTINAIFALPSRSNGLRLIQDTFNFPLPGYQYDVFDVNPFVTVVDTVNNTVTTKGYYYHFINKYDGINEFTFDPQYPIDFWYPINPLNEEVKLPVTVYITDSSLTNIYGWNLPCDSLNLPYDTELNVFDYGLEDFPTIYPNPSSEGYMLLFPVEAMRQIEVYDLSGRIVWNETFTGKNKLIDLREESKGCYILNVRTGNQTDSFKLLKL